MGQTAETALLAPSNPDRCAFGFPSPRLLLPARFAADREAERHDDPGPGEQACPEMARSLARTGAAGDASCARFERPRGQRKSGVTAVRPFGVPGLRLVGRQAGGYSNFYANHKCGGEQRWRRRPWPGGGWSSGPLATDFVAVPHMALGMEHSVGIAAAGPAPAQRVPPGRGEETRQTRMAGAGRASP